MAEPTVARPDAVTNLSTGAAPTDHPIGSALSRCVGSVGEFAAHHWGQAPLLQSGAGFTDLLNLADVDELLTDRGLRTPFIRLARNGSLLPASEFTGGGGLGAEIADQVRDDGLAAQLAAGATVVLQGLHRIWPPLRDFCFDLAADLGCAVQANAYLTPAGNTGFAAHYDTHDVFVLQVAGHKHWRVHEPVYPDPLERQAWGGHADEVRASAVGPPAIDHTLAPGDLLYLPRGWLHAATAQSGMSLHITLGLRRPTRYAIVEALLGLAADYPALRAGMPLGTDLTDPQQLAPHLAATIEALGRWLAAAEAEPVARRLRDSLWPASRPAPIRPVAHATAIAALTGRHTVQRRPGVRLTMVEAADRVTIEMADRLIRFPASCAPALRQLVSGAPQLVAELPGLDQDADRLVLVRRLMKEGVVVECDAGPAGGPPAA